jgi:hypothetical protein
MVLIGKRVAFTRPEDALCQPPNKQLERTVKRHHVRARPLNCGVREAGCSLLTGVTYEKDDGGLPLRPSTL